MKRARIKEADLILRIVQLTQVWLETPGVLESWSRRSDANMITTPLPDDFFKVYYPMFGDFIAKLTVANEYGVSGVSDLFLHINKPPQDGSCSFSPQEGRALLDKFTASCSGWTDPEGFDIEFFAFWGKRCEESSRASSNHSVLGVPIGSILSCSFSSACLPTPSSPQTHSFEFAIDVYSSLFLCHDSA